MNVIDPSTSVRGRTPRHALRPLRRLLGHVRPHAGWAALTDLRIVYPWIIGSVVDLITATHLAPAVRQRHLLELSALAAVTGVLHALVLYGRGHGNIHLGDAIVGDLRRDLFHHLQRLSLGFYTRQRTGTILARVVHDVHEATAIIYVGIIVAALDAAQLLVAFVLMSGISLTLTLATIVVFPLYGIVFRLMNPRVRRPAPCATTSPTAGRTRRSTRSSRRRAPPSRPGDRPYSTVP